MRVAVNSHALPIYKKNSIASLLCIFETTIYTYSWSKYNLIYLLHATLVEVSNLSEVKIGQ